jgi:all-trans-retinol 13,14-reductase
MLVGKKYRGQAIDADYDVIIIGSGTAGLALGSLLARNQRKVLVLEQHYTAGGMTHTYRRKGFEWDVGLHYVGDVHRPTSPLRILFDKLTDNTLSWNYLGDCYESFLFPDNCYDIYAGVEQFTEELLNAFPTESSALKRYLSLMEQTCAASDLYFAAKVMPVSASSRRHFPESIKAFRKMAQQTTYDVLSTLTKNIEFMGVLTAQWPDYGLPPRQSSFAMQAMCTKHYLHGANYPVGGPAAISNSLTNAITSRGGQVLCNAEVIEILLNSSGARGVKLADGTEIPCPTVVCAGGIRSTFLKLLPHSAVARQRYAARLCSVKPSFSHLCLYVGLRGTPRELGLTAKNWWLYPGYNHDDNLAGFRGNREDTAPYSFVSFPSAKDPTWSERFPERATAEVMSYATYEQFERWQSTTWNDRGSEYESYKEFLAEKLLNDLYTVAPHLRGKVEYSELSTPLSTNHFMKSQRGEIYGVEHSPERFCNYWLRPQTTVPGVYLTGQDVATNGIGGALYSGVLTGSTILPSLPSLLSET